MDCSIIIVNYNTRDLVSNCIESIILYTRGISYEIIVVDNASTDGSQIHISANYPQVTLVENKINSGFGAANNIGDRRSKGKFLFLLNSDTVLLNDAPSLFLRHFESASKGSLGCLGCSLVDEYFQINGTGGTFPNISDFIKSRTKHILSRLFRQPSKISEFPSKVEYILGADMFMLKNIFEEVGGFDEQFFMYFEESDLQYRLSKKGYMVEIINEPKIMHLEGKSSVNSVRKLIVIQTSAFKYYLKNRPYWEYVLFRAVSFMDSFLLLLKSQYNFQDFRTYFKFNLTCL
jgi:GT2 family glycosyltransferase